MNSNIKLPQTQIEIEALLKTLKTADKASNHINNEKVDEIATLAVIHAIDNKLTPKARLARERVAAFLELAAAEWFDYSNEVNSMKLDMEDIKAVVPSEVWQTLSANKKAKFEVACASAVKGVNKSMPKFESTLTGMVEHLSKVEGKQKLRKENIQRAAINKVYKNKAA